MNLSLLDVTKILNSKGYKVKSYSIGDCCIYFINNYNFPSIPKGFVYCDGCIKQIFDIKLNNKQKQYKRDVKVLEKWAKKL